MPADTRALLIRLGDLLARERAGARHCDSETQDDYTLVGLPGAGRAWYYGTYAAGPAWRDWVFWQPLPQLVAATRVRDDGSPLRVFALAPESERTPVASPFSRSGCGFALWHATAIEVTDEPGPWDAELAGHSALLEDALVALERAAAPASTDPGPDQAEAIRARDLERARGLFTA